VIDFPGQSNRLFWQQRSTFWGKDIEFFGQSDRLFGTKWSTFLGKVIDYEMVKVIEFLWENFSTFSFSKKFSVVGNGIDFFGQSDPLLSSY
jgi:hypothetical protein